MEIGDTATARTLADAGPLARDRTYRTGRQRAVLPGPAGPRYGAAARGRGPLPRRGRPLQGAQALEAAAAVFLDARRPGGRPDRVHPVARPLHVLGAARDAARLQASFRAHGIRRAPRVKHRKAQPRLGQPDARPRSRSPGWWPRDCPTRRSPPSCSCPTGPWAPHVSHILSKLDVRSRIDIAREAAAQRALRSHQLLRVHVVQGGAQAGYFPRHQPAPGSAASSPADRRRSGALRPSAAGHAPPRPGRPVPPGPAVLFPAQHALAMQGALHGHHRRLGTARL